MVEAVGRIVALQAQEPASPYLALWNRIDAFDPAELDDAFTDRTVVKASLMRITLHAVQAGDHPTFHQAMLSSLRASCLWDRRFTSTGLSIAEADALVLHLVGWLSKPHSRAEIESLIEARIGHAEPGVW